ncbi:IPT/TIG domain-containing protein [Luteitalea pratensis]|nr:IPT/TIG domain-containing protein [Luteitalea pratensis]
MIATASSINAQPTLKTWYFAEGSTAPILPFEEEILIGNPTGTDAVVNLRFFPQDGSAPIPGQLTVKAYSRGGVNARQFTGANFGFAVELTASADVVVERSMYWGGGLFNFGPLYNPGTVSDMRAGHSSNGVNATQTTWSFAEGSAGFFQTYVLISNPGTLAANVRVNYLTSAGELVTVNDVVPSGQRRTYFANDALAQQLGPRSQFDFAIEVTSDVGVVAERAMYWNNFQGGHVTAGVTPQPAWLFAEGAQYAGALDTYVLLFNPNTEPIDVEVNFYGPGGLLQPVLVHMQPRTRAQVFAGDPAYPALQNTGFSISVVSVGSKPFVAERAVYKAGATLGDGTVATGASEAARKWGFADGQEGGFLQYQSPADADRRLFTTYYLVLNNTDTDATVRGVFYLEDDNSNVGTEVTITVPARSRGQFAPQTIPALHNRKFAAFFESDVPVVMERAMYWGNGMRGAHATGGTILPDTLPTLASPTAPPPPSLTGISPTRGNPSGGTLVTITGANLGLTADTTVSFGITGTPRQNVIVNNANSISVVTPPSGRGLASVIITTKGVPLELVGAFEFADPFAAGPAVSYGDLYGVIVSLAAARPFDLANSCREHGGNNRFMFEVVAELRRRFNTNRWGLNWKRGNVGDLSQDIVTYYSGPEGSAMPNSTQVRLYDIIGGHCGNASPFWVDQTAATRAAGAIGRWTVAPMCSDARYRDAKLNNGEWMFPECR